MYTWDFFVQELVNGLTLGSVYALIALGYSMVYGILKLLNFAHGEVYMIGAFIGYGVLTVSGGPTNPMFPIWLLIAFMFLAAMIGAGLARRRRRALRLQAAPERAADRAVDLCAWRVVLSPELGASALLG
jgi:branched-chain amino acid transport system permease protein